MTSHYTSILQLLLESSILLFVGIHDYKTGLIPDSCSLFFILLSIYYHQWMIQDAFILLFFCVLFNLLGWLGIGDTKLICSFALFHGPITYYGLFLACWICLIHHLLNKEEPKIIYFGPYLAIGFFFILLFYR